MSLMLNIIMPELDGESSTEEQAFIEQKNHMHFAFPILVAQNVTMKWKQRKEACYSKGIIGNATVVEISINAQHPVLLTLMKSLKDLLRRTLELDA